MGPEPACMHWPLPPAIEDADQYDMKDWQAGRCAICDTVPRGISRKDNLVLDHDHASGLVRGYLCRGCNNLEGSGGPHPRFVYWRNGWNPATIMGVVEQYVMWNGLTEAENEAMLDRAFGPKPTDEALRAAINRLSTA